MPGCGGAPLPAGESCGPHPDRAYLRGRACAAPSPSSLDLPPHRRPMNRSGNRSGSPRRPGVADRKQSRRPAKLHQRELVHVYRATEFSDDPDLQDPVWLVRELKQHPQLLGPLEEMLTPAPARDQFVAPGRRGRGRPRLKGSWPLVYLAFVISRDPAMESFWQRWRDSALWWEAGFEFVPDYDTLRLRFVELEKLEAERSERGEKTAFRHIADLLITQARRHEPRIGQVIHVDGTAWQTHARLHHACPAPRSLRPPHPRRQDDLARVVTRKCRSTGTPRPPRACRGRAPGRRRTDRGRGRSLQVRLGGRPSLPDARQDRWRADARPGQALDQAPAQEVLARRDHRSPVSTTSSARRWP